MADFQCRSFAHFGRKLLAHLRRVVGKDRGLVTGAGHGDIAKTRIEQVGMDARIGINEHTFGGESLGAMASNRVTVIEMAMLNRAEFDPSLIIKVG